MSGTWATDWATNDVVTAAEFRKSLGCVFDTTLGIAAASIDTLAIIPTTYAHLRIAMYLRGDTAATSTSVGLRFNNDSTAIYNIQQLSAQNATVTCGGGLNGTSINLGSCAAATAPANAFSPFAVDVPMYGNATNFKAVTSTAWLEIADTAAGQTAYFTGGVWKSAAAVTRVTLIPGAGNFVAGSRVSVYVMGS